MIKRTDDPRQACGLTNPFGIGTILVVCVQCCKLLVSIAVCLSICPAGFNTTTYHSTQPRTTPSIRHAATMSAAVNSKSLLSLFLLLSLWAGLGSALKFDLTATTTKTERCIRNFVGNGQLVVVTAIVSGSKGDGQLVNMHVCLVYSLLFCVSLLSLLRQVVNWLIMNMADILTFWGDGMLD